MSDVIAALAAGEWQTRSVSEMHFSTDVAKASAAVGPWLRRDPIANNPALVLLVRQTHRPVEARLWWSTRGNYVSGICFQVGRDNAAHVRTDDPGVIAQLADEVAARAGDVPGVHGQAAAAATFAAAWATGSNAPVTIDMFQRYYSLATVIPPPIVPGHVRPGTAKDLATVMPWAIEFQRDTHGDQKPDRAVDVDGLRASLTWGLEHGEIWLWDDDGPQAMVAASVPVDGVSRIHLVYTPPESRNRGLAAACTAAAVGRVLASGATNCVLFTDLANPSSNALYQRLGFKPHSEHLQIMFG